MTEYIWARRLTAGPPIRHAVDAAENLTPGEATALCGAQLGPIYADVTFDPGWLEACARCSHLVAAQQG